MAAIFSTGYKANIVGYPIKTALISVVTNGDWFHFSEAGIIPFSARVFTAASSGYFATPYYAECKVGTTVSTTTGTSVVVVGGANVYTIPQSDFAVMTTGGEILYVVKNSGYGTTGGTFTVIRGAYGTTATTTGMTVGSKLHILNAVKFSGGTSWSTTCASSKIMLAYMALPNDPKASLFPQA